MARIGIIGSEGRMGHALARAIADAGAKVRHVGPGTEVGQEVGLGDQDPVSGSQGTVLP